MGKLILVVLTIVLGLVVGHFIGPDATPLEVFGRSLQLPGAMTIPSVFTISSDTWGAYTMTFQLKDLILWGLGSLIALYFVIKFVLAIIRIPSGTKHWFSSRKEKNIRKEAYQGINELLIGNYRQAEKIALANVERSELPVVNYLVAAYAAQGQGGNGSIDKRDQFLASAAEHSKIADSLLIDLSRSRMQLQSKQYEAAYKNLSELYSLKSKNLAVLNLYKEACIGFNQWLQLRKILPKLLNNSLITTEEHEQLLEQIAVNGITQEAQNGKEGILAFLKSVERKDRKSLPFAYTAVNELLTAGANDEALTIFKDQLKNKNELNAEFIRLALRFKLESYKELITKLDHLPKTQVLYSVIGQLHAKEQNWVAAKDYLERAVSEDVAHRENVEVQGLIQAYEQLNEKEAIPQLANKLLNSKNPTPINATIHELGHKVEASVLKERIEPVDSLVTKTSDSADTKESAELDSGDLELLKKG